MKIKILVTTEFKRSVVLNALQSAGEYLNGAKDLNKEGYYIAPHPGMSLEDNTVTLEDRYFNNKVQIIQTIQEAASKAVGIEFQFNSFNGIVGYKITDQNLYNNTIRKHLFETESATVRP